MGDKGPNVREGSVEGRRSMRWEVANHAVHLKQVAKSLQFSMKGSPARVHDPHASVRMPVTLMALSQPPLYTHSRVMDSPPCEAARGGRGKWAELLPGGPRGLTRQLTTSVWPASVRTSSYERRSHS